MARRPVRRFGAGLLGRFNHPAQVVVSGFGLAVAVGTVLLRLPFATESGRATPWLDALFTSTSAVCVTGLVTVDTGTHWSVFGEVVILGLIQTGGLGIMTLATLFAVLISRRMGLRARLAVQTETKVLSATDVRRVARNVVLFGLACEFVTAGVLTVRLIAGYGMSPGAAVYSGVFHSISAFNNAGFGLHGDSLMRFVADPWVSLTVATAVIFGGLGFPVIFELLRSWRRPRKWSVLTRLTLGVTAALLVTSTCVLFVTEYTNPRTLAQLHSPDKLLAAFFTAVMPRTAGFNSIDISAMYPESWLTMDILMFIGGGSAGTAGGIKVTTFGLLFFVVWTQLRGEDEVNVGHRRVPSAVEREAMTLTIVAVALVTLSAYVLVWITPHRFDQVLFEVVSAFGTVGLSTGITADLPPAGKLLITALMFIGRTGPMTLGAALALRERSRRYTLPEERPIVG